MKRVNRWMTSGFCVGIVLAGGCLRMTAQRVAFTWDDLPAHSSLPEGQSRVAIARAIIAAMQEAKLPPTYGFVNGVQIDREPASAPVLDLWRAAGLPLGNHTWSHVNLNEHTVEEFEKEIAKDEPVLKAHASGSNWHWFRYPYLAEGDDPKKKAAVRSFLAAHGYKVASVTMSFSDYAWNEPYARCVAGKDGVAITKLETTYLEAAGAALDRSVSMSKSALGRVIPFVLLMHVGAFDAAMLPRLLDLYRQRGVTFVTMEEAERDPFYAFDVDLSLGPGVDTLEAAMGQKHLPLPADGGPPNFSKLCR